MDEGNKYSRGKIMALLQSSNVADSDEKSTEFNAESEELEDMLGIRT